jgi:hypothetical protein
LKGHCHTRTLPSFVSSIVRRPTSCPCLSPDTSSSPWSSRRKSLDEPSRARAGGRTGLSGEEDLAGRVRGRIIMRRVASTRSSGQLARGVTWCQTSLARHGFLNPSLLYLSHGKSHQNPVAIGLRTKYNKVVEKLSPVKFFDLRSMDGPFYGPSAPSQRQHLPTSYYTLISPKNLKVCKGTTADNFTVRLL